MQEWLDDNHILMYFTHNEGKSVIAEWSIKTLKPKIFSKKKYSNDKITANDSKSYHPYLSKLVDQ